MGKYEDIPEGIHQPVPGGTGFVRPSGWRKATPELVNATQLADRGTKQNVPKTRCIVAVKRVGAHIGLKAADLLLLDTLAAFTQPQDWGQGRRPIVWVSNAYLMEQTGFSLSTLKRHARRLVEIGVIAFKDSPNGKRWGHRNSDGTITEAYGFDLAPMSARVEEFEELANALAEDRALRQRLKRKITILRRSIRARLETAQEAGFCGRGLQGLLDTFQTLLRQLPIARMGSDRLQGIAQQFSALMEQIERALSTSEPTQDKCLTRHKKITDVAPNEPNSEPHTPTTKQLNSVICSDSGDLDHATKQEPKERAVIWKSTERASDKPGTPSDSATQLAGVTIQMILKACPQFATWAQDLNGYVRGWQDFVRIAGTLRSMIGVSERAWSQAQDQMGQTTAAAALALVFEKVHSGEVASPGAYLCAMAKKAGAGELHLPRSFFGRLGAVAA